MKVTTAYSIAWMSVAVAVTAGIIISKSLIPLWCLLIPACLSVEGEG